MICFRRPSDNLLRQVLEDQSGRPCSYVSVGATATPDQMPRATTTTVSKPISVPTTATASSGPAGRCSSGYPDRGAGIRVFPGHPVVADQPFVLVLPLPVTGWAVAPGRVVYLLDEPDRFGFAYGTLPGHPERGEEAFVVVRANGRIGFQVIAFSRPRDWRARLGKPVARALQVRTIGTYLTAMEAAVR